LEIDLDVRLLPQVVGECVNQQVGTQGHRGTDLESAAGTRAHLPCLDLGRFDTGEHIEALGVVARTDFGEALAACSPVQQLCAQPFFERLHMVAGHGRGNPARRGRRREPAEVHHPNEDLNPGKPIHYQPSLESD
jgi:hypothetical protein